MNADYIAPEALVVTLASPESMLSSSPAGTLDEMGVNDIFNEGF